VRLARDHIGSRNEFVIDTDMTGRQVGHLNLLILANVVATVSKVDWSSSLGGSSWRNVGTEFDDRVGEHGRLVLTGVHGQGRGHERRVVVGVHGMVLVRVDDSGSRDGRVVAVVDLDVGRDDLSVDHIVDRDIVIDLSRLDVVDLDVVRDGLDGHFGKGPTDDVESWGKSFRTRNDCMARSMDNDPGFPVLVDLSLSSGCGSRTNASVNFH
jgi:hypothetical protein